ncbi:hypothetical protein B0H34DRAFT_820229, partial [Crassisporium funariophilum]
RHQNSRRIRANERVGIAINAHTGFRTINATLCRRRGYIASSVGQWHCTDVCFEPWLIRCQLCPGVQHRCSEKLEGSNMGFEICATNQRGIVYKRHIPSAKIQVYRLKDDYLPVEVGTMRRVACILRHLRRKRKIRATNVSPPITPPIIGPRRSEELEELEELVGSDLLVLPVAAVAGTGGMEVDGTGGMEVVGTPDMEVVGTAGMAVVVSTDMTVGVGAVGTPVAWAATISLVITERNDCRIANGFTINIGFATGEQHSHKGRGRIVLDMLRIMEWARKLLWASDAYDS